MIVGFTMACGLTGEGAAAGAAALERALAHFPWLARKRVVAGETTIDMWGHGALDERVHTAADGSLVFHAGRPVGEVRLGDVEGPMLRAGDAASFSIPWDGRALLVRVAPDGRSWTVWNDWAGSIPLFHTELGAGRIASTLEPVVVAAAGFTPDDFSLPALISLLLNGHYVGDWTLYRAMKVLPPDCVGEWSGAGIRVRRLWSVAPSDERWDRGWEELAGEMYERMREAILAVLRDAPAWTLPLSGGVDSRLIAAFGVQAGVPFKAFTYGPAAWKDTLFAREVARTLEIPWRRVDLGTGYLARYAPMWGDWFGSALHFHGMYQMPFLEAIRDVPEPIVTGFIGDPHGGAQTAGMAPGNRTMLQRLMEKWRMWSIDELRAAFRGDVDGAVEAIEAELEAEYRSAPGAHYQKVWMAFHWSHVFGFSYYQPMMYDYWKGVGTPFVNRELARFTLSLPRAALEGRRLQIEMVTRHLRDVAVLPVSFLGMPFKLTRKYLLGRGIAEILPRGMRRGPLRAYNPAPNTLDQDAIRAGGNAAVWPIFEVGDALAEWIDPAAVAEAYRRAAAGDLQAVNQLEAVQTLALRLRQS